jgi:hypothetical protein
MGLTLILATSLVALPASASTAVAGAPPSNLALAYNSFGGLRLTWAAPTDAAPEAYNVYRDGLLVATVTIPSFDDIASATGVYAVTAVSGGTQGAPATLWFFAPSLAEQQVARAEKLFATSPGSFPGAWVAYPWDCGLIGIQLSPFGYAVNMSCLPLPFSSPTRGVESP